MARVSKEITFTGTVGDITLYRWEDRIFVRKKSSLTRERVLKDKAFAGLRKHAGHMARASKLASEIYKQLPGDIKGRFIFRAIAGDAASLFYKGKSTEEVRDALEYKYLYIPVNKDKRSTKGLLRNRKGIGGIMTDISTKTANKHWKHIFLKRWEQQGKDVSIFEITWEHKEPFRPDTIPRIAEYFLDLDQASGLKKKKISR
jgi:hypothetical protein